MQRSLPVIVVVPLLACATIQPVQDPARFVTESRPPVVYVTHASRAIIVVADPRVTGDTLRGVWADRRDRPVALPLAQIRRMDARQRDGTRTALFMDVTTPAVAATQFTAYMALLNLVITYSAWWQGRALERLGYPLTLTIDGIVGLLSIALLPFIAAPRRDGAATGEVSGTVVRGESMSNAAPSDAVSSDKV